MALKVNMFYSQGRQGWGETFYVNIASTPQDWLDQLTNQKLRPFNSIRSNATTLQAVRASSMTLPRASALRVYRGLFGAVDAIVSQLATDPDPVSTDAVIRLVGANGIPRRVYLRGLEDDMVERNIFGNDNPPAAFMNKLNNYIAALAANAFAVRYTVLPPAGGAVWTAINHVEAVTGSDTLCKIINTDLVTTPTGWTIGSTLVFQGAPSRDLPAFPRTARILSTSTAPTFNATIAYHVPTATFGFNTPRMRATPLVYALDNIVGGQFERYSEHKTGKPFGALAGKSKGRRGR